jgi:Trk K+ transport system NAD-binding subunit
MIGQSFARRTLGGDALTHVIGEFDDLLIAEATAHRTPLVGKTLGQSRLRDKVGATVVGVWERGRFEPARAETEIHENTVLVLAGSKEQLFRYDELFCIYNVSGAPVVILGGGRVGRATARALVRREVDYRIVEQVPERMRDPKKYVIGSAADLAVLEMAGIRDATTVIITPHEDDLNVYLTIYCRRLRPDIQILARATEERNVATLHRAGADSVLSYASMGAGAVMNLLQRNKIVMVAEGLDLFEVRVPDELAGRTIAESGIRERTGCSLVAIRTENGSEIGPSPAATLPAEANIVLIATNESQQRFLEIYGNRKEASG